MSKLCSRCREVKEDNQFYKTKYLKSGLTSHCRSCQHEMDKNKRLLYKLKGPTIIKTKKMCPRCQKMKTIDEFGIKRDSADGRVSYCKPCWVIITTLAQRKRM